jgi:hypothetical protein
MTAVNYFELFNNYPIIKSSSRRDHFVKINNNSDIEIIENELLKKQLNNDKITMVY